MSCKDKTYPYPIENVSADGQIVTLHTGCGYVGISVADFKKGFNLGILAELFNFDDGTIVMVENGDFVVSPLSYDAELDSIVSTKRIIADEIQLSADTIELSQRLTIGAAGTIVEYFDEFLAEQSTPVITKYDRENGTLGTYSRDIGAEQSVVIQPTDAFLFTGAVYNPAPTTTTTRSNVNGIQYKFKNEGLNCRIKGTVTTTDGETRNLFGTDAKPYNYFVTTGGTNFVTFVKYVGGIGNFPGYVYDIYIEAYDPETDEATGEPLNMYGNIVDGVFTSYAKVFFQLINDVPFGTGGDVAGSGTAAIGDIPIYKTEDGKEIQTSGIKAADVLTKSDPLNKQSINIIANTVDIYEPNDTYNHYFYIGAAPALIKLKNPNDDYSEQDRFQVFNDSGNKLIIADNDDTELQVIQGGQAYEFFYIESDAFTGWKVETLRTRSRNIVEYDVSTDATPTLGPDQVGPLISITQSGNITIPMVFSLEAFDNFQTGDVIEISASNSYTNYFFGVLYTSSIGQQLVVYPNNSCRLTRTDTSWDVQQDGTFLRTGIRTSTSRNTPLEPDGSAMVPVNGVSIIDSPEDIATYIEDGEGHRVLQLDFTAIPAFPDGIENRFGVNNWFDNGTPPEYQQSNPIQFLEMECNGGYVNQVIHEGFGYTTYLRVYPGDYNTTKSVEFKDSSGRVSGRRTVRVGETWKVTSSQKDADADVYWERIDDGTGASDVYEGEFGSVSVAYNGLYGDDNRVYYPAVMTQDVNGWTQQEYTGNYVFKVKNKETGVIGEKTFQLGENRAEFFLKPYYNGDKIATQPFVADAIDSLLDVKTGDSANSNRLCKIPGYTNNYTNISYFEDKIQGTRFGEGGGLFELVKYQNTKYGYLLFPVNNVSQVIGRDVDENDLELGINFTDNAKLIAGKYGQDLPTPNEPDVFAKIAFDYRAIAYAVEGANQDANDPTLYIKSDGDSTADKTEAKVMGYTWRKIC